MNLRELLQKLTPKNYTCDVCGREVFGGERICERCYEALPWVKAPYCPICGRAQKGEGICLECKQALPPFALARSVFRHEGEAAALVVRFKRGDKFLFRTLAPLLLQKTDEFQDADMVSFVPMTKRAQRSRGYNQAFLLADAIAKARELPLFSSIEKVKESEAQKTLGKRERQNNLKGCFRVTDKKQVAGKTVLLVDDTLTTGATAGEVTGVLLRAHAKKVYLLTVTSVGEDRSS